MLLGLAISSVWPSAGALTTKSAAKLLPAPARFSTTIDWPSALPSGSLSVRAT